MGQRRVPIEPPPSEWAFPPVRESTEDDLIAIGADLAPGTLLAAYRSGYFPMPVDRPDLLGWWSPDPRAIIELDALRVTRSLRRSVRRYELRVDTAFERVIRCCADPRRPHGWITDAIVGAYVRLHELGWAHSVECWRAGALVGGLYGVNIGGFFAGESMFHAEVDASKVALVGLVEILATTVSGLLDVQWLTPHLESLGARAMPRGRYLDRLADAVIAPLPDWPAG